MTEFLLFLVIALLAGSLVLQFLLLQRRTSLDLTPLQSRLEALEKNQERTERILREEMARSRDEASNHARALREETAGALKGFNDSVLQQMTGIATLQKEHREEIAAALKAFNDSMVRSVGETATLQQKQLENFGVQLEKMTESNAKKHDELRSAVESKLTQIQTDNTAKLEEMRRTVDEKLQGTLEKRLGESFKLVSDRLEQVHKGLGEMQTLASGVGDLKKVLSNVKTRGTWGEIQLGNLLEQILSPEQYEQNVSTKAGTNERVEFAIKLPGRDPQGNQVVWLPIDAKFPKEDYERLVTASEVGDMTAMEDASRQLEMRLKAEGKNIREKYLDPPHTTDFGILFLPTEGLYAEVLRRPGLVESLQRDSRVSIAGPTTLAALLNALQMGFRTLAIEKRSSEVWTVLGAVKTEFGRFGEVIDKVQKKLQEASNVIDSAATRSRAITRKLRTVQELPPAEATALLGVLPAVESDAEQEDAAQGTSM